MSTLALNNAQLAWRDVVEKWRRLSFVVSHRQRLLALVNQATRQGRFRTHYSIPFYSEDGRAAADDALRQEELIEALVFIMEDDGFKVDMHTRRQHTEFVIALSWRRP